MSMKTTKNIRQMRVSSSSESCVSAPEIQVARKDRRGRSIPLPNYKKITHTNF